MKSHINNKLEKKAIVELVNINQSETHEELMKMNHNLMKKSIRRYIYQVFASTIGNVKGYLSDVQNFENIKFVTPFFLKYFYDVKAHYLIRAFGRDLSMKIAAYGGQALTSKVCTNDMTIYQVVPADLQGTFFFKIVQKIMRELPAANKDEIRMFKYGLFMLLHVETQASFAHTLNENMRDIMEELGVGSVPNMASQFEAEYMEVTPSKIQREVMLSNVEEMSASSEEEIDCSGLEEVFVRAAESIELEHDFGNEIRFKREQEKERMMRDIQERVATMKAK